LSLGGKKIRVESDARILGGEDFVAQILKEADKRLKRQLRFGGRKDIMDQVIKRMCDEAGTEEEELRHGGKRREVCQVRAKIGYHLSHEMGVPLAEIAREVGVCTSAVAKAIEKIDSRNRNKK